MNPKSTLILVVALVVAVGALWWAQKSEQPELIDAEDVPRKLFDLDVEKITAFEVKPHDGPNASFIKEDGKWRMTAPLSGPAEQGTLSSDLRRVVNMEYVQKFEKGETDYPDTGTTLLDRPQLVFKLTDDAGKAHILNVGAQQSLSQRTYVQRQGDDAVYLVQGDLNRDLRRKASAYRSKRIAEMNRMDVVRIQVQGEENYTVVKDTRGWTIESPTKARADIATVNKILTSMESLTAQEFVDDDPASLRPYGLENPRFIVTVTSEHKKPILPAPPPASQPETIEFETTTKVAKIAFGGKAQTSVFAKIADEENPAVFQVAETVVKNVAPSMEDLRDKRVASLTTTRAQRVKFSTPEGTAEVFLDGDTWRFASADGQGGEPADTLAVDDVLKAIRDLKALGFESGELAQYGLADPAIKLELTVEGQIEPVEIEIGNLTPSKTGVYVRNVREDFVATVPAGTVEPLRVSPVSFLSRELLTFDEGLVTRVQIERPGTACTLEQVAGEWRFAAPVEGICEQGPADALLASLSKLRGRKVVARADRAMDFNLDRAEYAVTVSVRPPLPASAPDDSTSQPASAPSAPPEENTIFLARKDGLTYAMRAGGETICEIDAKVLEDVKAEFLDRRVFVFEPSQAISFAVNDDAGFTFKKDGDKWLLSGEESFPTNAGSVQSYLNELKNMRLERYVAYENADLARLGLDAPKTSISVTKSDGTVQTLSISTSGPEDGGVYATISTHPGRAFVLTDEVLAKLIKKLTDFRKTA